ncbi:MAG: hypothetical protein EOM70_07300 [Clostridia bacterium]|nr:hypothetical protein [Clostridia bacterium]
MVFMSSDLPCWFAAHEFLDSVSLDRRQQDAGGDRGHESPYPGLQHLPGFGLDVARRHDLADETEDFQFAPLQLLLQLGGEHGRPLQSGALADDAVVAVAPGPVQGEKLLVEPGFRAGQNQAREDGLYRQKYCGCRPSLEQSDFREKILKGQAAWQAEQEKGQD